MAANENTVVNSLNCLQLIDIEMGQNTSMSSNNTSQTEQSNSSIMASNVSTSVEAETCLQKPLDETDAVPAEDACGDASAQFSVAKDVRCTYSPFIECSKDADICMIHSENDGRNVEKLKCILTKFITLKNNGKPRKLTFFPVENLGSDQFDWITDALTCSRFKFLYFDTHIEDEMQKFRLHLALWDKIQRRDQSIVPVKARRDINLPYLIGMFRALEVSQLLRHGKTLDDIHDVATLTSADVDQYFLQNIERLFDQSPANKPRVAPSPRTSNGVNLLRKHYTHLVDKMDPDNGLLGNLFSSKVITHREMETIRVKSTFYDRNEHLIEILVRQNVDDKNIQKFFEALAISGQGHLSSLLSSEYSKLSSV